MLFLIALAGLFSQSVSAAGILIPFGLFQFDDANGHYIFVGRDHHASDTFQIWDIDARDSTQAPVLSILSMKKGSTHSPKGGLTFFLEGNTQLTVPDYDDLDIRASIAYPNRAREHLFQETASIPELERLGLLPLLHPDFLNPPASVVDDRDVPFRSPQTMNLVVAVGDWHPAVHESATVMKNFVEKELSKTEARFLTWSGYGEFSVLIENDQLPRLMKKAKDLSALRFEVISDIELSPKAPQEFSVKQPNLAATAVAALAEAAPLNQKLAVIVALIKADVPVLSRFTATEKAAFIDPLRNLLFQVEAYHELIYGVASADLALESSERMLKERPFLGLQERMNLVHEEASRMVGGHPLYQRLGAPMRDAEAKVLEFLHLLDTTESRRAVLLSAHKNRGAGLHLMETVSASADQNYLDFWLGWLRDGISEASVLARGLTSTERREAGFGSVSRSSHYTNLKGTGSETVWMRIETSPPRSRFSVVNNDASPLFLLGLSRDARTVRANHKKIVNFIIQADKVVQAQLQSDNERIEIEAMIEDAALGDESAPAVREFVQTGLLSRQSVELLVKNVPVLGQIQRDQLFKTMNELRAHVWTRKYPPTKITGNPLLHGMIYSLVESLARFERVPGFSSEIYLENVMAIVSELLESAQVSIATPGTYQAVLDAGLSLLKKVDPHSRKAVRLTQTMQKNFLNGLWYLGDEGCDQLLTPNPWKAWMKRNGKEKEID